MTRQMAWCSAAALLAGCSLIPTSDVSWCVTSEASAAEVGHPVGTLVERDGDGWAAVRSPGEEGNPCQHDAGPLDAGSQPDAQPDPDSGRDSGPEPDSGVDSGVDAGPPPPPLDPYRVIATGWVHTCVLFEGDVYCWGDNEHGQLGNGTSTDSSSPVLVSGLPSDIVEVSATGYFTCALAASGQIWCWGQNTFGQLGDRTTETRRAPVRVMGVDAVRMAAGGDSVCALQTDGSILCWGRGSGGALGQGELRDSSTPVGVIGLDGEALGVEGSGGHYCARLASDSVACWGWNRNGQLGRAYDGSNELVPTPVEPRGLADIRIASAGGRHTCVRAGDSVACWGWNMFGQLGNGMGPDTHSPVIVSGLDSPAADLSAGGSHTCTLLESGDVYCWGGNDRGQLGVGDTMARGSATRVSGFTARVLQVSTGDFHSCAALSTGDVACWGGNFEGQLGTGNTTPSLTPVIIDVGP